MLNGHVCRPYAGIDARDGCLESEYEIPLAYKRNPWCWAPGVGFHRALDPLTPIVGVTVPRGGRWFGPREVDSRQAFALGRGLPVSNLGTHPTEGMIRMLEAGLSPMVSPFRWAGDVEPLAELGYRYQSLVDRGTFRWVDGAAGEALARDTPGALTTRREVFRRTAERWGFTLDPLPAPARFCGSNVDLVSDPAAGYMRVLAAVVGEQASCDRGVAEQSLLDWWGWTLDVIEHAFLSALDERGGR